MKWLLRVWWCWRLRVAERPVPGCRWDTAQSLRIDRLRQRLEDL